MIRLPDWETVVAKNLRSGEAQVLAIAEIAECLAEYSPSKITTVSDLSDEDWLLAKKRYDIIAPIISGHRKVYEIAGESGIGKTNIYRWIEKFNRTGCVSALTNDEKNGGRGQSRLQEEVESIVQSVINEKYLKNQKLSVKKINIEVILKCREFSLKPPGYHTIWNRVNSISLEERLTKRNHSSLARYKYEPLDGSFPGADYPLAAVQIDHTPMDIMVVDEVYREAVGKPWITVAIDVYSRMVLGFYISLDPPGALGTGLCISNAILPKELWLSELEVPGKWPCHGVMKSIYADNAKEFHGKMLERGCQEYGIEINFRPVTKPHYGGHIERLMGTIMGEVHSLPGTTFSNIKERKHYDSDGNACFTLRELEQWLATFIVGVYHQRLHTGLGTSPFAKYTAGILGNERQPGIGLSKPIANTLKLKLDFMPFVERSIQRYGVAIDFITYYHDILRKWVHAYDDPAARYKSKRKFAFKRDPRDISAVYFYDPEIKDYFRIPYRNTSYPSITIWEHKRITRHLKEQGLEEVDEELIFETYNRLKEIEARAVGATADKRRRRNNDRKQQSLNNHIGNEFPDEDKDEPETEFKYDPNTVYLPFEDLEHDPFNRNK